MGMMDPRRAGRIQRYHTWPHIREQSVAEHSWNLARIVRTVWPDAPPQIIDHCLFHDIGEVVAGDPPYPSKKLNPAFGQEHGRVEFQAHQQIAHTWGMPMPVILGERDQRTFKLVEFIEMAEWAMDELVMGNLGAREVLERCDDQVNQHLDGGEVWDHVAARTRIYIKHRNVEHHADMGNG